MTAEELAARRPVWAALSDLFLDTDVRSSYPFIARTLAESPYSIDELHSILDEEVTPALRRNLLSVAGEWAGFDEDWVVAQVVAHLKARRLFPVFGRRKRDWGALVPLIESMRFLPDSEARLRRQRLWQTLLRLFLDKPGRLMQLDPDVAASEEEFDSIFQGDLMPALRDGVVELSRYDSAIYPSLAEVEENWRLFLEQLP